MAWPAGDGVNRISSAATFTICCLSLPLSDSHTHTLGSQRRQGDPRATGRHSRRRPPAVPTLRDPSPRLGGPWARLELLQDPRLEPHARLTVADPGGPHVLEIAALRTRAECSRWKRHVDLSFGAAPQREADQFQAGKGALLVEDQLGL